MIASTLYSQTLLNNWTVGTYVYTMNQDCLDSFCSGLPPYWSDGFGNCFELNGGTCEIDLKVACPSDVRLKDEIVTIESALETLLQLEPLEYDWDETYSNYQQYKNLGKLHSLGFIAQDVKRLIPEAVTISTGGYYHVEYPALNAYLVEAIKEQQVFIDDISEILSDLENKVESYNG
jgi:hypothetical protein